MSRYENCSSGICKFLLGVGVGLGIGYMTAPRTGKETRAIMKEKFDDLVGKAKNLDLNEVRENILAKVEEIKNELRELDKEKVLAMAKKQAKAIQAKAEDLYRYAVKKGTPVVQKAADEVRLQALKVAKDVVVKLEKTPNTAKPKKA